MRLLAVCFISCLTLTAVCHGATGQGSDLITMKNGEIHNGIIDRETFSLETAYGEVAIPYSQMAVLRFGNGQEPDHLVTRLGDNFSGRVLDRNIRVRRVLDPVLPLHTDDISEITFAPGETSNLNQTAPHSVETQSGDRFAARILISDFILQGTSSIHLINHSTIELLDVATLLGSEDQMVQVILNDGRVYQGRMTSKDSRFKVENRYGQTLEIPIAEVSTLAFKLNYQGGMADFNPRRRTDTARSFRDRLVDGTQGPEMIELKGGEFLRGDTQGDGDNDEKPAVTVTPGPFAIGVFEVTFEEYDRFCNETGRNKPADEGWGRGRRPVINVSWEDASAFTKWLSAKTRQTYRLPSDAEWEYAARAGTSTRFWWGDEIETARANCEGCGSLWDGEKTAGVGKFSPNPFGLHDTSGNVFEWVADCYHDSFADAPRDGSPIDKPGCGKRVIRGGAWSFPPREIRSANRWRDFPSRHSDDTGFRVVREIRR